MSPNLLKTFVQTILLLFFLWCFRKTNKFSKEKTSPVLWIVFCFCESVNSGEFERRQKTRNKRDKARTEQNVSNVAFSPTSKNFSDGRTTFPLPPLPVTCWTRSTLHYKVSKLWKRCVRTEHKVMYFRKRALFSMGIIRPRGICLRCLWSYWVNVQTHIHSMKRELLFRLCQQCRNSWFAQQHVQKIIHEVRSCKKRKKKNTLWSSVRSHMVMLGWCTMHSGVRREEFSYEPPPVETGTRKPCWSNPCFVGCRWWRFQVWCWLNFHGHPWKKVARKFQERSTWIDCARCMWFLDC